MFAKIKNVCIMLTVRIQIIKETKSLIRKENFNQLKDIDFYVG